MIDCILSILDHYLLFHLNANFLTCLHEFIYLDDCFATLFGISTWHPECSVTGATGRETPLFS